MNAASIFTLKRQREKLSETINRVRTDGTGGIKFVLWHPGAFVLSARTGTWSRDLGDAVGVGPTNDAQGGFEVVPVNEARDRLVAALQAEEAEVLAKLREAGVI